MEKKIIKNTWQVRFDDECSMSDIIEVMSDILVKFLLIFSEMDRWHRKKMEIQEHKMKRFIKQVKKLNKGRRATGLPGYYIIKKGVITFLNMPPTLNDGENKNKKEKKKKKKKKNPPKKKKKKKKKKK